MGNNRGPGGGELTWPLTHICYLVESLAESLDSTSFDLQYSGTGHPAYHPAVLLKILIMGIIDRIRSSRRLAKNVRENIVYVYLSEKTTPDFRTISDFRKNNAELLKEVFKHTVSFAKEEGLLDLSYLCTDGSKIKANASNKAVMKEDELKSVLRFVEEERKQWAERDASEDDQKEENRTVKIDKKTVQKRAQNYIKKLKEKSLPGKESAIRSLERAMEAIKTEKVKEVSTTDPESRFMKTRGGRIRLS